MRSSTLINILLALIVAVLARPYPIDGSGASMEHYEVLNMRASTKVDPHAVLDTVCIDPTDNIIFHNANVAELSICGGIAGAIERCEGSPQSAIGSSGTALFSLSATNAGATINISKGRWEGCVRAARAVCPTGSFTSTCVGGASPSGNVFFSLAFQQNARDL